MDRFIFRLALIGSLAVATLSPAQYSPKAKPDVLPRVSTLWNDLAQPMSVDPFVEKRTLREAIAILQTQFRQRHDRELPFLVNEKAFKDENPEAGDLYESEVKLHAHPRIRTMAQILRGLLAQVRTGNATYFLKPGVIEITTHDSVWPTRLLQKTVDLKFTRQPLSFVLEEIYEQTGVNIVLDPRVGVNARALVTLTFTNEMTLGTGIMLMAEMAHLRLVVTDNASFITTPLHARQFIWERTGSLHYSPLFMPDYLREAAAAPLPNREIAGE